MSNGAFSLKDQLFNPKKVRYFTDLISASYPAFDGDVFLKEVLDEFPHLELKQRISHMTKVLKKHLPADYLKALEILLKALPPALDPDKTDDDFGDFILAPFADFVAQYGCHELYFEASIKALKQMTMCFSVEDAIRYFINAFPKKMHGVMMDLSQSSNYHQRRLASEGSRLRLPWCQNIPWSAADVVPILDQLYSDKTRYVTRSVANSLNDISKIDPDCVFQTLARWEKEGGQTQKEMKFIKRHALRTLLKKGNSKALALFGFTDPTHVELLDLACDAQVKKGTSLSFSFKLSTKDSSLGRLRVEYAIHFLKANGKHSDKVFKIKEVDTDQVQLEFSKMHSFKSMTTRRHYQGHHQLGVIVNGKELGRADFNLD